MYSINIGDQFARSIIYMGSVIWQKKTTMNTTGGANVMGSYPYPPNGMIEIDYEFIYHEGRLCSLRTS